MSRRYEDRVTVGGRPLAMRQLPDGRWAPIEGEMRGPAMPANPQQAGEGHGPMVGTHAHPHSAYGQPGHDDSHVHSHNGDANHDHDHVPAGGGVHLNVNAGLGLAPGPATGNEEEQMAPRSVSGISLEDQIRAFLAGQGVDVDQALRDREYEREHQARRAAERTRVAGDIAFALRRAKRALAFEQQGFAESAPGFSIAKVSEAQQRVGQLDAALREACVNDPAIIAEMKAQARG